jgi:hypothetical protein
MLTNAEIMQTVDMLDHQKLDIRTITMGVSLRDCADPDPDRCAQNIYDKICRCAERLVPVGCTIEAELGIPIVNKRISVTPIALVAESCRTDSYPTGAHEDKYVGTLEKSSHHAAHVPENCRIVIGMLMVTITAHSVLCTESLSCPHGNLPAVFSDRKNCYIHLLSAFLITVYF